MRKPRKYSKTGFYHIVIRGVNKQNIFFDDEDKKIFLLLLKKYCKKFNIQAHAYCLMENHVHLLLEDFEKKISLFMQTLASVYAKIFNKKYDRIGHLFQERFASEVIEDTQYYMTVFRYILQNPKKAGIQNKNQYKWTSYKFYTKDSFFINRKYVLKIFGSEKQLYNCLDKENNDYCLEIELRPSEKEKNYITIIQNILKTQNPIIPQELSRKTIEAQIRKIKAAKIPTSSIARITGIPIGFIRKITA